MPEFSLSRIKAVETVVGGKPYQAFITDVSASDDAFLQCSRGFCCCSAVFKEEDAPAVMRPYSCRGLANGLDVIVERVASDVHLL